MDDSSDEGSAAIQRPSSLPCFKFFSYTDDYLSDYYSDSSRTPSPSTDSPYSLTTRPADISVSNASSWSYCGPLLHATAEGLPSSFYEWSSASIKGSLLPAFLPFLAFINEFLATDGLQNYWLTIRATKKTNEYNQRRWHTDDLFYTLHGDLVNHSQGEHLPPKPTETSSQQDHQSKPTRHQTFSRSSFSSSASTIAEANNQNSTPKPQTAWKLCTTLLGPSTLFIPPKFQPLARHHQTHARSLSLSQPHTCLSMPCLGCATATAIVRSRLADELAPYGVMQSGFGECVYFRVGTEHGAVHSEPCMSEGDRIFVNVVPGTEDELKGLVEKWGLSFPRSWWVGEGILRGATATWG